MSEIDGLLKNLKKKSIENENLKSEENFINEEHDFSIDLEKKKISNNILKDKILDFFQKELDKNFGNFFLTDEGKQLIRDVLKEVLEKKSHLIESILKEEIIAKVNEAVI